MANPHAIGNAFHITTDESMTWNQIYQKPLPMRWGTSQRTSCGFRFSCETWREL